MIFQLNKTNIKHTFKFTHETETNDTLSFFDIMINSSNNDKVNPKFPCKNDLINYNTLLNKIRNHYRYILKCTENLLPLLYKVQYNENTFNLQYTHCFIYNAKRKAYKIYKNKIT